MVRYKPKESFPKGRYPVPLKALHIPDTALDDRRVNDLSLRLFNSARAFILAHELAHIRYLHTGHGPEGIKDEEQADRFALDVLSRTATIPMGMILYFQSMAHWAPNRAQFSSEGDWQRFLRHRKTHPLTGERVRSIADASR